MAVNVMVWKPVGVVGFPGVPGLPSLGPLPAPTIGPRVVNERPSTPDWKLPVIVNVTLNPAGAGVGFGLSGSVIVRVGPPGAVAGPTWFFIVCFVTPPGASFPAVLLIVAVSELDSAPPVPVLPLSLTSNVSVEVGL